MPVTKRSIANLVIDDLSGGNAKNFQKLDPREVYERLEQVRNSLIEQRLAAGHLDGEFITQYKDVTVTCDEGTDQRYSVLPAKLISLSNYAGLWQVSPMKAQDRAFIKINNGALNTYATLEAGALHGNVGYYMERVMTNGVGQIRIYYKNIPMAYSKVLIKQISSVDAFDEDESLPVPAEYEGMLTEMVRDYFKLRYGVPLDLSNNNNPNN